MLAGTCHCGAIRVEIPELPARLTSCNCSMCRRLGTLWAYYPAASVTVHGHPERTAGYVQGDRTLRTVRCATCGCVSHWESLLPESAGRVGVNMRLFEPALLQAAELELLDGATTWTHVPARELLGARRGINRRWHAECRMPREATTAQRVDWHKAHAMACGCRPVPASILRLIAAGKGG